jgi:hypothetical protein
LQRLVRRSRTPRPVPDTRAADGAWANRKQGDAEIREPRQVNSECAQARIVL